MSGSHLSGRITLALCILVAMGLITGHWSLLMFVVLGLALQTLQCHASHTITKRVDSTEDSPSGKGKAPA